MRKLDQYSVVCKARDIILWPHPYIKRSILRKFFFCEMLVPPNSLQHAPLKVPAYGIWMASLKAISALSVTYSDLFALLWSLSHVQGYWCPYLLHTMLCVSNHIRNQLFYCLVQVTPWIVLYKTFMSFFTVKGENFEKGSKNPQAKSRGTAYNDIYTIMY